MKQRAGVEVVEHRASRSGGCLRLEYQSLKWEPHYVFRLLILLSTLLVIFLTAFLLFRKSDVSQTSSKKPSPAPAIEEKVVESEPLEENSGSKQNNMPTLPISASATDAPPNPLPIEWEEPFFDILDNSKSRKERNSRLYLFASTTAQTSPRVQEECLAHLSFGIDESEKEFALQILKDLRISEGARLLMFENLGKVRSDEFIYFLASNISTKLPESGLKKAADKTLTEFEPFTDNASKSKNKGKQPKWDNKKP